ncbi:MAG: ribose 5-phosphate isomerase B [Gemmatimonadetes bacterium]|nr:ribose 5-phosphate isomerase B [Gemmatimonadota bacterium]
MKIALASDHAGLDLRQELVRFVRDLGHEAVDLGTESGASCDYPDYAKTAARSLAAGEVDRAILVCGTGQGVAMTANRFAGVRCCVCTETFSARMSRAHNDANALAMGAWVVGTGLAQEIVRVWLDAAFDGGRHTGRVAKIDAGEIPE